MARANLGAVSLAQGRREDATRQLRSALQYAADDRPALLFIGNGLRRAGDAAGALQAMQAAVETGGDATPALLAELALAQRAAGDREPAIASLRRALSLDSGYATAHYLLGNMLAGSKRFGEAKEHYRAYLKLEPKGPHAGKAKERLKMLAKAK